MLHPISNLFFNLLTTFIVQSTWLNLLNMKLSPGFTAALAVGVTSAAYSGDVV